VNDREHAQHVAARAAVAGVPVPAELAVALAAYLDFLATWNRKINLTALPLEPATDEAIDRLIVEPLVAVRHVRPEDRLAIDIGSGGGSPAIPMRLAAPALRFVLVEVKSKKAAFLRAVVRELSLSNVEIENRAAGELPSRSDLLGAADIVTMRAVRADANIMKIVQAVLRDGGRLFWFGAPGSGRALAGEALQAVSECDQLPDGGDLCFLRKTQIS
jgi:16S rRNA (guanine527-N7)-methyltransferase